MNTQEVQREMAKAIETLKTVADPSMEITSATNLLMTMKEFSASANGIPGLRGLGLNEALELARSINTTGLRGLRINTTELARSVSFSA